MKQLLLTGGGTAGHVIPNLAIVDAIRECEPKLTIRYMGSFHGIEKDLATQAGLPYDGVETGKLRRYLDWNNVVDAFRIPLGLVEAWWLLGRQRPSLVFSKGGYVALPVVWAAWLRRIPVWIHDSDASPGLATRLCAPFARRIFLGFETARLSLMRYSKKTEVVGNPIRLSLMKGSRMKALQRTGLEGRKPVLIVMGGSSGAAQLNQWVDTHKKEIVEHYEILHICGAGQAAVRERNYVRLPYVNEGLADLYALASLALTRAGANTLAELAALNIPSLLVPLSARASRGDQLVNARVLCLENPLFKLASADSAAWMSELKALPLRTLHADFKEERGLAPNASLHSSTLHEYSLLHAQSSTQATEHLAEEILDFLSTSTR